MRVIKRHYRRGSRGVKGGRIRVGELEELRERGVG